MNNGLELLIDEPIDGHYYWTIVWRGQAGELPRVLDYARGPMSSRQAATEMGAEAVRRQQNPESKPHASLPPAPVDTQGETNGRRLH